MDLSVGPFRLEVLEGLKRVSATSSTRTSTDPFDLTWEGARSRPCSRHRSSSASTTGSRRHPARSRRPAVAGGPSSSATSVRGDPRPVVGHPRPSWGVRPSASRTPGSPPRRDARPVRDVELRADPVRRLSILYICSSSPTGRATSSARSGYGPTAEAHSEPLGEPPEHAHVFVRRAHYGVVPTLVRSRTRRADRSR